MSDCLFCAIVAGEIPATIVHDTATTIAFRDIDPKAPTHVLVIPKAHHRDMAAIVAAEPSLAGEVMAAAIAVAQRQVERLQDAHRLDQFVQCTQRLAT